MGRPRCARVQGTRGRSDDPEVGLAVTGRSQTIRGGPRPEPPGEPPRSPTTRSRTPPLGTAAGRPRADWWRAARSGCSRRGRSRTFSARQVASDGRPSRSSSPDSAGRPPPPPRRWPMTTGARPRHSCSYSPAQPPWEPSWARPRRRSGVGPATPRPAPLALGCRQRGRLDRGDARHLLGATGVGATWPWWLVVPAGTVTGLVAGLHWGRQRPVPRRARRPGLAPPLVLGVLRSRLPAPCRRGRGRSGRLGVAAPAPDGLPLPGRGRLLGPDRLVVLPGHPERKTWWRNLVAGRTWRCCLSASGCRRRPRAPRHRPRLESCPVGVRRPLPVRETRPATRSWSSPSLGTTLAARFPPRRPTSPVRESSTPPDNSGPTSRLAVTISPDRPAAARRG